MNHRHGNNMTVWLFGLSAGLSFVLLITAGSINSTEIQEQACPPSLASPPATLCVALRAGDSDSDGMSDAYELFYGLNSANPADVLLDYDGDALTNLAESVKLTDPFCEDTDRDGFFDDMDEKISRAYIRWGDPQFTTGDQYEYAHPDWLLGAYKNCGEWAVMPDETATNTLAAYKSAWHVASTEPPGAGSLSIDLTRTILTNNLRYAIHYVDNNKSSLYLDLLDTNGVPVLEDLYGNLMTGSNEEAAIILEIPTVKITEAAVIQLRRGEGEIIIYEGLLYIDEDGDGLDADQEKQIGTSDYCVDSNNNGTNDYDECFNTGSSTNNPGGGGDDDGKDEDKDEEKDKQKGVIYVDQALGNDAFSGRSPAISANKGPKKTVRGGLSIAETNDTIIIRSGNYNENLNIIGKDVKVFIEGKVRL